MKNVLRHGREKKNRDQLLLRSLLIFFQRTLLFLLTPARERKKTTYTNLEMVCKLKHCTCSRIKIVRVKALFFFNEIIKGPLSSVEVYVPGASGRRYVRLIKGRRNGNDDPPREKKRANFSHIEVPFF